MKPKRKPPWLKQHLMVTEKLGLVRTVLHELSLNTVCEEARCPNRNLCYSRGQATFMIMGNKCTRNCAFCAVSHGCVEPLDDNEPRRIADAAMRMKLKYIVVTSVTRDDLPDGGAEHFAKTIVMIRKCIPPAGIEVLTPDFLGDFDALQIVLDERPDVFNHNIETVPRLYAKMRPQADFQRSLNILKYAAKNSNCIVKSGLMVGMDEKKGEVIELLKSIHAVGVEIVTIGQYLQPSRSHPPVQRYVEPHEFDEYARIAEAEIGFRKAFAEPLVRSSFMAYDIWMNAKNTISNIQTNKRRQ